MRLDSARFPRKPFAEILNIPMIQHVWERACLSKLKDEVVVITPDQEIYSFMKKKGANTLLSKFDHSNGTSRVAEFADYLNWDNFVILQGDEPLIRPEHLDSLINFIKLNSTNFTNVVSDLKVEDLENENVVKCLINHKNEMTFMFRRNPLKQGIGIIPSSFAKVNGLYALSRDTLNIYTKFTPKQLEISESIEQFRFLENDISIMSLRMDREDCSVNNIEEFAKVIEIFATDLEQIGITNEYVNKR